MYIQITTRCNMRCAHCGYSCRKTGKDMALDTYRKALEYVANYGDTISIGGGEPTLHPDFWTMLFEAVGAVDDGVPWLATNGSNTAISLVLAKMAKKGVIACDLSQDPYHDEIDDCVVAAFTHDRPRRYGEDADCRGIRDTSHKLVKAGRCKTGTDDCLCSDLFVNPAGDVFACGCKGSPKLGNVHSEIVIPDEWEIGTCYKEQPSLVNEQG